MAYGRQGNPRRRRPMGYGQGLERRGGARTSPLSKINRPHAMGNSVRRPNPGMSPRRPRPGSGLINDLGPSPLRRLRPGAGSRPRGGARTGLGASRPNSMRPRKRTTY